MVRTLHVFSALCFRCSDLDGTVIDSENLFVVRLGCQRNVSLRYDWGCCQRINHLHVGFAACQCNLWLMIERIIIVIDAFSILRHKPLDTGNTQTAFA